MTWTLLKICHGYLLGTNLHNPLDLVRMNAHGNF